MQRLRLALTAIVPLSASERQSGWTYRCASTPGCAPARLANYNNVLTLGVSPQGLYLASMFFFRFMHPPAACSMERDQGAKEEGLGVRVRDFHDGARVGNPFADSWEAGGEAARVGWKLLAS
jgi:hypothetical protein